MRLADGIYLVRNVKQWIPAHTLSEYAEIADLGAIYQVSDYFLSPPKWTLRALCLDLDADLFYGEPDDREPRRKFIRALAISVCEQCPVRNECLSYSISLKQYYGIWGGTDIRTRALLIREAKKQEVGQVVARYLDEEEQPKRTTTGHGGQVLAVLPNPQGPLRAGPGGMDLLPGSGVASD